MKRSPSSKDRISTGGIGGGGNLLGLNNMSRVGCGGLSRNQQQQRMRPNTETANIGRLLLGRPKLDDVSTSSDVLVQHGAKFCASAASTPIRQVSICETTTLKPCLSSSSILKRSRSSTEAAAAAGRDANVSGSKSVNKNEEFNIVRNVSFSHSQVREYEVTLGDNPAVSSGAPVSLGWRYCPNETVSSLLDTDETMEETSFAAQDQNPLRNRRTRSRSELRLSESERHYRISSNRDVTSKQLYDALQSVAEVRLGRKESLDELRKEAALERIRRHEEMLLERDMEQEMLSIQIS